MKFLDLVSILPVHPTKPIPKRKLTSIKKIVVHCTDWVITPEDLALYDISPGNHISKTGCPSITYHWLVKPDATATRTAEASWILWHAGLHNGNSLAVSLVYKTDPRFESGKISTVDEDHLPTDEQLQVLEDLIVDLCLQFKIPPDKVLGHRELIGTGFIWAKGHKQLRKTCPGRGVSMDALRDYVTARMQFKLGVLVDGHWGKKSQAALVQHNHFSELSSL